ncbi:MAG: NAD(P)/FAD-dependent oxidoreductase [Spirochaetota bacterium]
MNTKPRVLVLGGGFAGTQATKALLKEAPDAEITLVDPNSYATMLPALPDVLSGRVPREAITKELSEIFPDRVRLVRDRITDIDFNARALTGESDTYTYDYLVLTTGSRPAFFGFSPESGTVHTLHSYEAAKALRSELAAKATSGSGTTLIVVGAGYTGLEVAACTDYGFAQLRGGISILVVEKADTILTFLSEKARKKVRAYLKSIDVELRTGVSLARLTERQAELSDGTTIEHPVVCWSAGMQAANDHIEGQFERTADKRLKTDEYLRLPAHPDVFVAGDAAALTDGKSVLRRAINFAYYSGRRAGSNCARVMKDRSPRPFRPLDLGWVIPLGTMSIGRVFGILPVGGKLGLRLHYFMSGFRHFGVAQAWEFLKTAAFLRRAPDRPDRTEYNRGSEPDERTDRNE